MLMFSCQSNVFVNDSGSACLADFGLVVVGDRQTTTKNGLAGSLQWTAPERIASYATGDNSPRRGYADDVYAYGCLCIEVSHGTLMGNKS